MDQTGHLLHVADVCYSVVGGRGKEQGLSSMFWELRDSSWLFLSEKQAQLVVTTVDEEVE